MMTELLQRLAQAGATEVLLKAGSSVQRDIAALRAGAGCFPSPTPMDDIVRIKAGPFPARRR